jgi:hypothetical protein
MKFSKLLADRGGKLAVMLGQRAQRAAGGLVMGGGAMAMRGSFGRLGAWAGKNEKLLAMRSSGGMRGLIGKSLLGIAGKAETSSFDVRGSGAGKLLAKQTGMDFGKAGGKGGWKGVAEQKEKEIEKKIAAVAKLDLSDEDKKKRLQEIYDAAPSESKLGKLQTAHREAQADLAAAREQLERARAMGASAAVIGGHEVRVEERKKIVESIERDREEEGYKELNKLLFGANSSERHLNYSSVYAESMRRDAYKMGAIKAVGGAAAGGLGLLFGGPALTAAGIIALMGSGRLVSGAMRSIGMKTPVGGFLPRRSAAERGTYTGADGSKNVPASFLQAMGANPAVLAATNKAMKNIKKLQEKKEELEAIKREIAEAEASGTGRVPEALRDKKKKAEKDLSEAEKKVKGSGGDKGKKDKKKDEDKDKEDKEDKDGDED